MKIVKTGIEIYCFKTILLFILIGNVLNIELKNSNELVKTEIKTNVNQKDPKYVKPIIGDISSSFNNLKQSMGKDFPKEFVNNDVQANSNLNSQTEQKAEFTIPTQKYNMQTAPRENYINQYTQMNTMQEQMQKYPDNYPQKPVQQLQVISDASKDQNSYVNGSRLETISRSQVVNSDGFTIPAKRPQRPSQPVLESVEFVKKTPSRVEGNPTFESEQKRYSTPVRVDNSNTENGFENPTFIHKNEKVPSPAVNNIHSTDALKNIGNNMEDAMKKEIQTFINQLDNAPDKRERTQVCMNNFYNFSN